MGHSFKSYYDKGVEILTIEIAKGSLGISETSHALLVSLVFDANEPTQDRPFESIVEAFRFAFTYGYSKGISSKKTGKNVTVAPRQFIVNDYLELLREEAISKQQSLGGLISGYAEAGCIELEKQSLSSEFILDLLD